MLRQQGFESRLTKIGTKSKAFIDRVVIEFNLRHISEYETQTFLDSLQKTCKLENIEEMFSVPVPWKSIALDLNLKFKLDFDEIEDIECILKQIKVRKTYVPKKMSDVYTYDLVFEKEIESGDTDVLFSTYLNRKEEDENGKSVLIKYHTSLEFVENMDNYFEANDEE